MWKDARPKVALATNEASAAIDSGWHEEEMTERPETRYGNDKNEILKYVELFLHRIFAHEGCFPIASHPGNSNRLKRNVFWSMVVSTNVYRHD